LPALTFSFFARSIISGIQFRASPTQTTVDRAMHRCPAAPNAAPTTDVKVASLLASGKITPWFFAAYIDINIILARARITSAVISAVRIAFFHFKSNRIV